MRVLLAVVATVTFLMALGFFVLALGFFVLSSCTGSPFWNTSRNGGPR